MEEDQWRDALYPMTKAPEAKALFKSLQNYDTAYKVSELSVQSYGGGVGVEDGRRAVGCSGGVMVPPGDRDPPE